MNIIEITLQGLANNKIARLTFPASEEEIKEAYNEVSNNGMNDVDMVDYEADFRVDHFDSELLQTVSEMNKDEYKAFLTFCNAGTYMQEAFDYVTKYNYHLYEGCEDMGDVAYHYGRATGLLDGCPEVVKRHFDWDGYGEEMESGGSWFQDRENKRFIELF